MLGEKLSQSRVLTLVLDYDLLGTVSERYTIVDGGNAFHQLLESHTVDLHYDKSALGTEMALLCTAVLPLPAARELDLRATTSST